MRHAPEASPPRQEAFEARYQEGRPISRHIEVRDLAWANILPTLLAALPAEGHLLDLGSGDGALACLVAAHGLRVTALDRAPSGVALGIAQAKALGVTGVTFRQVDLDSGGPLPVDEPVDIAFASEILEHVSDDRDVLRRARECMLPGARLFATSPSSEAPVHRLHVRIRGVDHMDVERGHLRRYSFTTFSALAEDSGFREVSVVPIGGLVRDCIYGSRIGLRASRFMKRPATRTLQLLDRATIPVAPSQLLLTAVAP